MIAYDDNAEYDVPSDGTTLPELLPVDDEPGMIRMLYSLFFDTWALVCCVTAKG